MNLFLFTCDWKWIFIFHILYPNSVSSPSTTPSFFTSPFLSFSTFLSLTRKKKFLRNTNKLKYNETKHKQTRKNWKKQENKRKRAQGKAKKLRFTHSHSFIENSVKKNTKLETTVYLKRAWYRPLLALCMLPQSLSVHITFAHADLVSIYYVLHPPGSYIPSTLLSGVCRFWGEGFDGYVTFRAAYSNASHSLHLWLWVSVFIPICCMRKILR